METVDTVIAIFADHNGADMAREKADSGWLRHEQSQRRR